MRQEGIIKRINTKPDAPKEYQLFDPHELIRLASTTLAVESDNGVSTLIPRKRLVPLESDSEEASAGQIGNYTCPYLNCPYGNYALGFSTRVKRNTHMLMCLYRYGPSPSQVQLIRAGLVSDNRFQINQSAALVAANSNNNMQCAGSSSSSQIALSAPVTQACYSSIMQMIPENNNNRQLPAEINNNNCEAAGSSKKSSRFPEVGTTTTNSQEEGFHYLTPELGGLLDHSSGLLSPTDEFLYDDTLWFD